MIKLRKLELYASGQWILLPSMGMLIPGDVFRMIEPDDNSFVGECWIVKEFPVKNNDDIWEVAVDEFKG